VTARTQGSAFCAEPLFVLPEVTIRPIRPSDAPLLAASHARLSPESIRRRYLAPKPRLTRTDLRYLTEVDGVDHVAYVAALAARPDELVGVARFVRSAEDPRAAEAAVVVADELQAQGLGRRLGMVLADAARERGITRFTATTLSDNVAAHHLFASISERLTATRVGGIDELVAELPEAA
jgi:RimJ/RimL family protein N-acetyltransferase